MNIKNKENIEITNCLKFLDYCRNIEINFILEFLRIKEEKEGDLSGFKK